MNDDQAKKAHDKKILNEQLQKAYIEIEVLEQKALRDMENARIRLAEILNKLEDLHD